MVISPDGIHVIDVTLERHVAETKALREIGQRCMVNTAAVERDVQSAAAPLVARQHSQQNILTLVEHIQPCDAGKAQARVNAFRPGQRTVS